MYSNDLRRGKMQIKQIRFFVAMWILFMFLFMSCKHRIEENQRMVELEYIKVPFPELDSYLANKASKKEINYIEITHLTEWCLKGNGYSKPSPIAKILRQYLEKKVAIRFGDDMPLIKDMSWCFRDCTNLIFSPVIPETVTDVSYCFDRCSMLVEAPVIPKNVTNMAVCFWGCLKIKTVKLECPCPNERGGYRTFTRCRSLVDFGIKVQDCELEKYRHYARVMETTSDKFAPIE